MKTNSYFEMTNDELNVTLSSLKQELFNLRFKHSVGQLENANQLNICKKNIAKVKTILRQRELNISVEPAKKSTKKATK
ncbi:MAG: 50S ribosomal protein L29 [Clostridia bacterium]